MLSMTKSLTRQILLGCVGGHVSYIELCKGFDLLLDVYIHAYIHMCICMNV